MALSKWSFSQISNQLNHSDWWEWTGATITYSFPTSPFYMNESNRTEKMGFLPVTSQQQPTFQLAIQMWDDLIARGFTKVENTSTDIEYAFSSSMDDYAHVNLSTTGTYSGNTWFSKPSDVESTSPGEYGFDTIMHETGHALGLDHMGDYNAGDGRQTLPSSLQDTEVYTIMSYFGPNEGNYSNSEVQSADWVNYYGEAIYPQTPMIYDVYVIQQMYGASTTTRTGNTTYGFSSNITDVTSNILDFSKNPYPVLCIFDSSGTDTINLSGFSSNSKLFLASGEFSSCNDMTNNLSIAYNCTIENGITGSGNDQIYGNSSNNSLSGGLGNDSLCGLLGNDTIDGGQGSDHVRFFDLYSNYSFSYTASKNLLICTSSIDGKDYVYNIEYYIFNDGMKSIADIIAKATVTDETAPTLTGFTPVKAATDIPVDTNLVLTFSENVKAGSGFINIYDSNGNLFEAIPVSNNKVTFNQGNVSINPSKDLSYNTTYYINYDIGAILDTSGSSAQKITDSSTITFSTAIYVYPDDYPSSQPGRINLDAASTTGAIENVDDSDFFAVTLKAGSSYQFDLTTTNASFDPDLRLYDIDGEFLTGNDGIEEEVNYNSRIIFSCDEDGIYYLEASDYSGNPGSYSISGLTLKDDYPLDESSDGMVAVNQGGVNGNIDFGGDGDLFKITLEAGTTYALILNSSDVNGLSDPLLDLYDNDLEFIEYDDDYGGDGNSLIFYTPTISGTYYLGAYDYESGTGRYGLKATTGTIIGTSQADYLIGVSGNDTLSGGEGNDIIYGAVGADSMNGGLGDDGYYTDNKSDKVVENANEGDDWVITTLTTFVLPKNVEHLVFEGTGNFNGTGNDLDNMIVCGDGSNGRDIISAGKGNDSIKAYAGSDKLSGGAGSDTFYFELADYNFLDAKNFGQDTITDFKLTDEDYLAFDGFGDSIDIVWNKSEGIAKESVFFYSQFDGVIYYHSNENSSPFQIVKLMGKPYITDEIIWILS